MTTHSGNQPCAVASRVRNDFVDSDANDGSDRNSAIYTRFAVAF